MADSDGIWITSFTNERSQLSGIKPAPMPWIICGPGGPPERTGDSAGSTIEIQFNHRIISLICGKIRAGKLINVYLQ